MNILPEEGRCIWFGIYLFVAAWQDLRTREIDERLFVAACVAGMSVCMAMCFGGQRAWPDVLLSCGVGVTLLWIGRLSDGGIGDGDGWFFVISGLFLKAEENVGLFFSGLCVCFCWSLPLAVKAILQEGHGRKRELPFLPCLIPFGLWLVSR